MSRELTELKIEMYEILHDQNGMVISNTSSRGLNCDYLAEFLVLTMSLNVLDARYFCTKSADLEPQPQTLNVWNSYVDNSERA